MDETGEVKRCKDCKWWDESAGVEELPGWHNCRMWLTGRSAAVYRNSRGNIVQVPLLCHPKFGCVHWEAKP